MESQLFKITQNAVIENKLKEILILRHLTGNWLLPGGKINKGENWLEGLKRELNEELGISNFKIRAIVDVDSWLENERGYLVITYLIELSYDPQIKLSEEHDKYEWVNSKDLEKYQFWHPKILERIRKALA